MRVIASIGDLMFRSKVMEAAKVLGVDVTYVRDTSEVFEQLRLGTPDLIILDLNAERFRPLETLQTLRRNAGFESIPIVGYVGHTATEIMEKARELGATAVLTNGQFAARLPQILAGQIDE